MSYKILKKHSFIVLFFVALTSLTSSCRLVGFYEPVTLDLDIPDGPAEYKAGYRAGCRSGLGAGRAFAGGFVYDPDHGTGVYQHDSNFVTGWSHGWFTCVIHASTFSTLNAMKHGPLE